MHTLLRLCYVSEKEVNVRESELALKKRHTHIQNAQTHTPIM